MYEVEGKLVSEKLFARKFVCDLEACKGACCVEGDYGAPLKAEEIEELERNLSSIEEFMSEIGLETLKSDGFWERDPDGDFVTTTYQGRECVFANKDERGILYCSIERAQTSGKSKASKPLSCHLYPIRVGEYSKLTSLYYHEWNICSAACELGANMNLPVFRFLKKAIIRAYGESFYAALEEISRQHYPEDEPEK